MSRLYINKDKDLFWELKLLDNENLYKEDEFLTWIPFDFKLKTSEKTYINNTFLTFTLSGLEDFIFNVKKIISNAKNLMPTTPYWFYPLEASFSLKIEDPNEYIIYENQLDNNLIIDDIEIELWPNLGYFTDCLLGFKFMVTLNELNCFILDIESNLSYLLKKLNL